MSARSFQTVTLSRGRHASADDGTCVVELASMIAGEPFSDHPQSVSPVLAAFLRCYNDVADEERQDLLRCAADVVGTRADADVERARIRACLAALDELAGAEGVPRPERWLWRQLPPRLRRLVADETVSAAALEKFAHGLALMLRRQGAVGHQRAMRLVDDLIDLDRVSDAHARRVTSGRRHRSPASSAR